MRGLKPRETTFKNEYFSEFEIKFKNISGCEFGDYMGSIHGKNQRSKISCYCPFKFHMAHEIPQPRQDHQAHEGVREIYGIRNVQKSFDS
jgi:hypothetical protein